jgi:hypothetical protein
MLTTPQQATFVRIIAPDPLPDMWKPTRDFRQAAAKTHARFGSPFHATTAELEFNFDLLDRRYASFCSLDHMLCSSEESDARDEQIKDLWLGYGPTTNRTVWHLYERKKTFQDIRRGLRKTHILAEDLKRLEEFNEASLRAAVAANAQNAADYRAYLKKEFGADIQREIMPRDRSRKDLGARPQRKAARAIDFPIRETSLKLAGKTGSEKKGPPLHLADREVLRGIKKIGDWLMWPDNKGFKLDQRVNWNSDTKPDKAITLPQFCVETFLKVGDPGRFAGADMPAIAYWKELPSRKFYRNIAAELAKNPT